MNDYKHGISFQICNIDFIATSYETPNPTMVIGKIYDVESIYQIEHYSESDIHDLMTFLESSKFIIDVKIDMCGDKIATIKFKTFFPPWMW